MLSPGEIEDPQITSEQLLSLKSDLKIIGMLEELSNKHCPAPFKDIEAGGKISKCNDTSLKLREEGAKMLRQKKYQKAILAFTESIANAEPGSEYLGLAYGGRSEVLFERGYYKECLRDIQRAKENNYPAEMIGKLEDRKAQAEHNLPNQETQKYHENLPNIPNINPKIPCASDSIEIQSNSESGKQVVAIKDIPAGEIIAIEQPYVVAVGIGPSQKYLHCHECLELCYNLIPCQKCRTALYCSEECQSRAFEEYHYSECDLCQYDFIEQISVKTVLRGVKESASNGTQFDGTVYRSDRFEEVQEIETNKEKRTVREFFEAANEACIYTYFLKKYSDFFTKTGLSEERLKELLFHQYLSTSSSKISVEKTKKSSVNTEFHVMGDALYPFASLLKHDCYANLTTSFFGSSLVLRAAKDIKKGESCSLTYRNYNFAEFPKVVRTHQLWQNFHFNCKCDACENNWPIFDCLNPGNTEQYLKLVETVQKALESPSGDASGLLKTVTKKVRALSSGEPTKVDVNIKRIFCDLLKMPGNKILEFYL
ncbi:histone-lysine N-methyltransferase SMYD3-like [Sitophilus oryzae]|uniref:Histone-lysine N-methyltransferase SMYD3-like n=1 Tax=Sitophilus oryzae TaxID=7048 RepID=A0A6J2YFX0_SITOR|nr:histone-lysine N-methyltransferase SMYD3-like [Sitophilus oryzae]